LKVKLSRDKLKSALRDDPEFRVLSRYWSGSLRFDIGDDVYLIKIKDGEVNAVDAHAPATSGSGDVVITAPADGGRRCRAWADTMTRTRAPDSAASPVPARSSRAAAKSAAYMA